MYFFRVYCRLILSNILTCDQVSSRLYATQFLSILLRTKLELQPDYLNWVVESIVNQLQDEKKLVSLCALSALDEACDDKVGLVILYEACDNLRGRLGITLGLHAGGRGLHSRRCRGFFGSVLERGALSLVRTIK
jgi:hypothetical protein